MSISSKMENNPQLQEFVERLLSCTFNQAQCDELFVEDMADEMGITEDEMWWMYEQLGYSRDDE